MQVLPSLHVYSSLLSLLLKAEHIQLAESVMRDIRARGIIPNTILYNVMLDVHALQGQYTAAIQLWREMRAHNQPSTPNTYRALMQAAIYDRKPHEAKQLFHAMQSNGIKPDLPVYLQLLSTITTVAETEEFFAQMKRAGYTIHPLWYSFAFRGLFHTAAFGIEAEALYKHMLAAGIRPTTILLGRLACYALKCNHTKLADYFIAEAARMQLPLAGVFETLLGRIRSAIQAMKALDFCMEHIRKLHVVPSAELGRLLLKTAVLCDRSTEIRNSLLRELETLGMPVNKQHRLLVENNMPSTPPSVTLHVVEEAK